MGVLAGVLQILVAAIMGREMQRENRFPAAHGPLNENYSLG